MKICSACGDSKPVADFNRHTARRDGLQDKCRPCSNAHARAYHHGPHKARHLEVIHRNTQRYRDHAQQFVYVHLATHPCVDCGYSDVRALEFDHQGDKLLGVGQMIIRGYSIKKIEAEIAKCEVRCRNCHQIKTGEDFGHYRNRLYKSG